MQMHTDSPHGHGATAGAVAPHSPLADARLLFAAALAALLLGSAAVLRGRAYALPRLGKTREAPAELQPSNAKAHSSVKARSPMNAQAGPSTKRADVRDEEHMQAQMQADADSKAARSKDRRKRGKDMTKGKKGRALLDGAGGSGTAKANTHSRTTSTASMGVSPYGTAPPTSPTTITTTLGRSSSSRSASPTPSRSPSRTVPTPSAGPNTHLTPSADAASLPLSGTSTPSIPRASAHMDPRGPSPRPAWAQAHPTGSAAFVDRAEGGSDSGADGVCGDETSNGGEETGGGRGEKTGSGGEEPSASASTEGGSTLDASTARLALKSGGGEGIERIETEIETETETETETEGTTAASSVVLDAPEAVEATKASGKTRTGNSAQTQRPDGNTRSNTGAPAVPEGDERAPPPQQHASSSSSQAPVPGRTGTQPSFSSFRIGLF